MGTAPIGSRARDDIELLRICLQLLTRVKSHASSTTSANSYQRIILNEASIKISDVLSELEEVYNEWKAEPPHQCDENDKCRKLGWCECGL